MLSKVNILATKSKMVIISRTTITSRKAENNIPINKIFQKSGHKSAKATTKKRMNISLLASK